MSKNYAYIYSLALANSGKVSNFGVEKISIVIKAADVIISCNTQEYSGNSPVRYFNLSLPCSGVISYTLYEDNKIKDNSKTGEFSCSDSPVAYDNRSSSNALVVSELTLPGAPGNNEAIFDLSYSTYL